MKKIILGFVLATSMAFAQNDMHAPLTSNDIHDVIELLRFVRTAKPELFEEFAASFEAVGESCEDSSLDEKQADELADIIETIEKELPQSNGDLLGKIKLALMFYGKTIYHPQFIEKEKIRENISKFMFAIHQSYSGQNFDVCTQLISKAQESKHSLVGLAAAKVR